MTKISRLKRSKNIGRHGKWRILGRWLGKCQIVFMISFDLGKNDFNINPQLSKEVEDLKASLR